MKEHNPEPDESEVLGCYYEPIAEEEITYDYVDGFDPRDIVLSTGARDVEQLLKALRTIKHRCIGSDEQKQDMVKANLVPRLVELLNSEAELGKDIVREACIILGSIGKGYVRQAQQLLYMGVLPHLFNALFFDDAKTQEAALRGLKAIFTRNTGNTRLGILFQEDHARTLEHLLHLVTSDKTAKLCLPYIIYSACKDRGTQMKLLDMKLHKLLLPLLVHTDTQICEGALLCMASLYIDNRPAAEAVMGLSLGAASYLKLLESLREGGREASVRRYAAICLTELTLVGLLNPRDSIVYIKTVGTLISLMEPKVTMAIRASAAKTLCRLIHDNPYLQSIAAMTNGCMKLVNQSFFHGSPTPGERQRLTNEQLCNFEWALTEAGFEVFAELASSSEVLRKEVAVHTHAVDRLLSALMEERHSVALAVLKYLLSLSRSVRLMRTVLSDIKIVWQRIANILVCEDVQPKILEHILACVCNVIVDVSGCKEVFQTKAVFERLGDLVLHPLTSIRLHAVWALMNCVYDAPREMKERAILESGLMGDKLLRLLSDTPDSQVVCRALTLLRNVLVGQQDVDYFMGVYGDVVMQAVVLVLEAEFPVRCKEIATVVLSNIAHGAEAQDRVMGNEDILRKIVGYMQRTEIELQIAAVQCVSNLACSDEDGFEERQERLREMGAFGLLEILASCPNALLRSRVHEALCQF